VPFGQLVGHVIASPQVALAPLLSLLLGQVSRKLDRAELAEAAILEKAGMFGSVVVLIIKFLHGLDD
jgi:hypothetical protein